MSIISLRPIVDDGIKSVSQNYSGVVRFYFNLIQHLVVGGFRIKTEQCVFKPQVL